MREGFFDFVFSLFYFGGVLGLGCFVEFLFFGFIGGGFIFCLWVRLFFFCFGDFGVNIFVVFLWDVCLIDSCFS